MWSEVRCSMSFSHECGEEVEEKHCIFSLFSLPPTWRVRNTDWPTMNIFCLNILHSIFSFECFSLVLQVFHLQTSQRTAPNLSDNCSKRNYRKKFSSHILCSVFSSSGEPGKQKMFGATLDQHLAIDVSRFEVLNLLYCWSPRDSTGAM